MSTKCIRLPDGKEGWLYEAVEAPEDVLNNPGPDQLWEPAFVDSAQFVVLNRIMSEGSVDLESEDLQSFLKQHGYSVDQFVDSLTGLVAAKGASLVLLTRECAAVMLPDGRCVVGENVSGRVTRWVERYMSNSQGTAGDVTQP